MMSKYPAPAPSRAAAHGQGRAVLQALSESEAVFSALSYRYPLKLLSPRTHSGGSLPVGIAYMLSYGGGLVGGDRIELEVDVGEDAALMLLTQVCLNTVRFSCDRIQAHSRGEIPHR